MEKRKVNLIGISGKMGSGKDTAAILIKRILSNSTLTDGTIAHIVDNYNGSLIDNSNWHIKKFGGKLKEIVAILTGAPVSKLEDQKFKSQLISESWGMTFRELMQKIGTEGMRNGVDKDIWINSLFDNYDEYKNYGDYRNWIITDVRFKNEAQAIKKRGGVLLRIESTRSEKNAHQSENELDDYPFDYFIDNDGKLEEFALDIRKFLQHINLI